VRVWSLCESVRESVRVCVRVFEFASVCVGLSVCV
jgi:hypothetical protein